MIKQGSDQSDYALAKDSRERHTIMMGQLFRAKSESDVRQCFLNIFGLDRVGNLEMYRIDYVHPEIWLEFKYCADLKDRTVRCRIIAQILHYLHYAPMKRGEYMLPESFGIIDKSCVMFFNTEDFLHYFANVGYFNDIKNPSSSHPDLEKALYADPVVDSRIYYTLREYSAVWDELSRRGAYT